LADPITTFLSGLFGGGQQQTPPPPGQPSATPAPNPALAPPSGVTGFLSNPLTQGALASYLTYIGAPRTEGRTRGLSQAGLQGLSAFDQARQQQLMVPYRQAQIQNLQGKTGLQAAQTGLATAKASQLTGILDANKNTAAQILALKPTLTPEQQTRADLLAGTIATDSSKVYDPKEVMTALFTDPLTEQKTKAEIAASGAKTDLTKAETGLVPARAAALGAEAGKATAETGAIPARTDAMKASAEASRARASALGAAKPMTADQIEKSAIQAGRAAQAGVKQGTFETKDAFQTRSKKAYDDAYSTEKQRLKTEGAGAKSAIAAAPELPEGWTAGEPDAAGRPTAVDPSGVPHHWEE
jgi:hypothetical protein